MRFNHAPHLRYHAGRISLNHGRRIVKHEPARLNGSVHFLAVAVATVPPAELEPHTAIHLDGYLLTDERPIETPAARRSKLILCYRLWRIWRKPRPPVEKQSGPVKFHCLPLSQISCCALLSHTRKI